MTDITAKPFDWNDNLSKEALEDFEGIQKDLPYCTCQNIGMALAKLELLEKQGCKVIEPKSEWQQDHEILKAYSDGANDVLDEIKADIEQEYKVESEHPYGQGLSRALEIIDRYKSEGSEE
jgi:hypothetical protein